MNKELVHFDALGYEPFRMKPVHFAAGFFLSVAGQRYELERLNHAAVIKHNTGLRGEYAHENLLLAFKEAGVVDASMKETEFKALRVQINGVVGNDDAIYGSFGPYKKPPGVAYTMASDRLLFDHEPLDGYSGHLVHAILGATPSGKQIVEFAREALADHKSTLELLITPALDEQEEPEPWNCRYFGELDTKRLKQLAAMMKSQTEALATLCRNLRTGFSHETRLRNLVVALCAWLFVYLHKRAALAHSLDPATPLLLMDFLGGTNSRLRATSRLCFARQRGRFFESYRAFRDSSVVDFEDEVFAPKPPKDKKPPESPQADFKFLEEHYSDLAVRIGFAQPRAWQARRKHFELQPDTARMLLLSVITPEHPLLTFEEVADLLRETWGVCCGGCNDDLSAFREDGYTELDDDDDLKPNTDAFVDLLKRLNVAAEPSDGLILCAVRSEELP